jgi:hypothetical protein
MNMEKSEELEEFVRSTIEGIKKGTPDGFALHAPIEFEVAVVKIKEVKGGFKLFVVDASGKYDKEAVSRVKFKIGIKGYGVFGKT